jgi:hypothetical protein
VIGYLVSMLELTQYACRRGAWQESVTVGSPLRWPHRPDSQEDTATLRTPGYPIEADVIVPATADPQDSRFFFVWGMTDHAGIYELSVGRRGGGTETMAAAVNVDPAEGDLARVDRDRLLAMARPLPAEYVAGAEAAPARDDRSGSEFWPALLAAAVALLMIEQFLGWYFGKGG